MGGNGVTGIGCGLAASLGGAPDFAGAWAQEQWDTFAATDTYDSTDEQAGVHVLAALYNACGGNVPADTFLCGFLGSSGDLTAGLRCLLHKDGIGTAMTAYNLTGADFLGSTAGLASNGSGWVFTGYEWNDMGPWNQTYVYSGDGMQSSTFWHFGSRCNTSQYNAIVSNSNTMTTLAARTAGKTLFRPAAPDENLRDHAVAGFTQTTGKLLTFYVDSSPEDYFQNTGDPGTATYNDSIFARPTGATTADNINNGTKAYWCLRTSTAISQSGMMALQRAMDEANGYLSRPTTGEVAKNFSLVPCGDSLTWGQSDTFTNYGNSFATSKGWTTQLRALAPTLFIRPYAAQGWSSGNLAANPTQINNRMIDVLTIWGLIWIGNNDVNVLEPLANIQANIVSVVDNMIAGTSKGACDKIIILTVTPRGNDTQSEIDLKADLNNWILNTLPGLYGAGVIITVDVAADPYLDDGTQNPPYYDNVHLTEAGYTTVANLVLSAMQSNGAGI